MQFKEGEWVKVLRDRPELYSSDGTRGIKTGDYLQATTGVNPFYGYVFYHCNHPDGFKYGVIAAKDVEPIYD